MIRSIGWEYHFPPYVIKRMFLDDIDYQSIGYWFDHAKDMEKQIKAMRSKPS